ncbi:MAG: hypothetical protein A2046_13350 [Bacteroidetes bacterium GWA2_30_7]|nr:MAG: hypothetical protein A2046_13350 [Bacteroidetes bacterium GWA2_30_7]
MKKIILIICAINALTFTCLYSQILVSFVKQNPECYGFSNGNIELNITGGVEPYSIIWTNNSGIFATDTNFVDNLQAGKYWFDITDFNGLTATDTVYLTTFQISTIDEITDAPCYSANGAIKITPQGGREFYFGYWRRMVWNPSLNTMILDPTWQDSSRTNIDTNYFSKSYPKGFYILTVVDSSGLGCSIVKNIEIKEPTSQISLQETHTNNICKFDTAALIQVNAYGGTNPYLYSWSSGKTTPTISNLKAGLYTVTVSDSKGCTISESINVEEPFQEILLISEKNDVSCRDNHDGSVSIQYIENSIAPYTYKWSNSETTVNISNLDADIFIITVTDGNNCKAIDTFDVKLTDIDCITINNVITPDGNGKNDYWIIDNIHLYPKCEVSVFDRWGNIVFNKTSGYDNLWNADYKGNP